MSWMSTTGMALQLLKGGMIPFFWNCRLQIFFFFSFVWGLRDYIRHCITFSYSWIKKLEKLKELLEQRSTGTRWEKGTRSNLSSCIQKLLVLLPWKLKLLTGLCGPSFCFFFFLMPMPIKSSTLFLRGTDNLKRNASHFHSPFCLDTLDCKYLIISSTYFLTFGLCSVQDRQRNQLAKGMSPSNG